MATTSIRTHDAPPTAAELRDQMRQRIGRLEAVNAELLAACKAILALPPRERGNIEPEMMLEQAIAKAESR